MVVAVVRREAEGRSLWGFGGRGADGEWQPEGVAVEGDGSEVDGGGAQNTLIFADGIRDRALNVCDLCRGGVDDEFAGGSGLDGGTGGFFERSFPGNEGECFGA